MDASTSLEGRDLACLRGERLVFENVSFRLEAGGGLLLTGANGSGKTSFIRLVAGLLRPHAGRLMWQGAPVDDDPERYHAALAYVGHLDAVKGILTVAENLAFWARLGGGSDDVAPALARFGLAHLSDIPGRFLSSGQRRRLALARLVAAPSQLWLLDEPTVGLDTESIAALEAVLADHLAAGGMVIAATHTALALDGAATMRFGA